MDPGKAAGGVIAYISSSSSSPQSCLTDPSPQRGPWPSGAPEAGGQDLPGPQRGGRSSSSGKCGITKLGGLVLLCKVCGDVASGFHYGVHACEGCKGFFRRSIQQNLQYRKCLQKESCSIMRINRNRCQQCRFKKCLLVGMSRDAVRFGRIPKREKQRLLLEMQSAMDSMISSSSAPAVGPEGDGAADRASEEPGCTPSPSSSTRSDSSSNSEAAVAMDTGSSSASDSGEDEVIGSVTRVHQETFMYNQEHGARAGPDSIRTTSDPLSEDAWNQNLSFKAAGRSLLVNVPRECPFRSAAAEGRGPALTASELCTGGAWSRAAGSRKYLVCPMNRSPNVDPQKSGPQAWDEFSVSFTPAVREVVEFAKKIPGFRQLSQHDQVSLLKAGTFEVLVVRFASLFDVERSCVTFLGGSRYPVDTLRAMGAGGVLSSMMDFSKKLLNLGLSEEEMSLFTAVVLVSADRSGIENVNSVEALQETLIRALRSLITRNHQNGSSIFTKLLLRLPDLRSLNNMHSEQLLAFKVHS